MLKGACSQQIHSTPSVCGGPFCSRNTRLECRTGLPTSAAFTLLVQSLQLQESLEMHSQVAASSCSGAHQAAASKCGRQGAGGPVQQAQQPEAAAALSPL